MLSWFTPGQVRALVPRFCDPLGADCHALALGCSAGVHGGHRAPPVPVPQLAGCVEARGRRHRKLLEV